MMVLPTLSQSKHHNFTDIHAVRTSLILAPYRTCCGPCWVVHKVQDQVARPQAAADWVNQGHAVHLQKTKGPSREPMAVVWLLLE